jgi:uncharacterized protein YjbI with pentapeptide repeats
VSGNNIDHDAASQAIFLVIRRETLALAIAARTHDGDGAVIAAARLRWALSSAEQVIALSDSEGRARRSARLDTLRYLASRWLDAVEPPELPELAAETIRRFLGRISTLSGDAGPRISAAGVELEDLELDELDLRDARLSRVTLADITARSAVFDAADLSGAHLLRSELQGSSMARATLNECDLEQSTLWGVNLECASMLGATVSRCAFHDAALVDTWLDGAMFTDCDLRGADLRVTRDVRSSRNPTSFVRCDLRNTYWHGRDLSRTAFIHCRLHGARGDAFATRPYVGRPDMSRAADGSGISSPFEVANAWAPRREDAN